MLSTDRAVDHVLRVCRPPNAYRDSPGAALKIYAEVFFLLKYECDHKVYVQLSSSYFYLSLSYSSNVYNPNIPIQLIFI